MSSCLKMSNLHPMVTSVLLSYFDFFWSIMGKNRQLKQIHEIVYNWLNCIYNLISFVVINISIFENHYAKTHTHLLQSTHFELVTYIQTTKVLLFIIYSGNPSNLASKVRSQSKFKKLKKNYIEYNSM